jgi:ABC-type multidrug transport system ATPase subunit
MRTGLRRRRIGFVYQFHHLLREFNALENVALPQLIAGRSRRQAIERARVLLDIVGLGDRARHRPGRLSGGEQQRIAFARSLANRPLILLADEPTGNLDPETAGQVFDELLGLVRRGGLAALVATHNMDLARQMDRVVALEAGRLIEITGSAPPRLARRHDGVVGLGAAAEDADEPARQVTPAEPGHPVADAAGDDALQPAWRRFPPLRQGVPDGDDLAPAETVSPQAEDPTEALLDVLYAAQHRDRPAQSPPAVPDAPERTTVDRDGGEDPPAAPLDRAEAANGEPAAAGAAADETLLIPRFMGRTKRSHGRTSDQ